MKSRSFLGEFEQLVMLAIIQLGPEAHGPKISRILEDRADRRVSRGALYSALSRLEEKEFLGWSVAAGSGSRGGHPMRLFRVTERGLEELRRARKAVERLSAGLDGVLG